jgi:hypothetical protein
LDQLQKHNWFWEVKPGTQLSIGLAESTYLKSILEEMGRNTIEFNCLSSYYVAHIHSCTSVEKRSTLA